MTRRFLTYLGIALLVFLIPVALTERLRDPLVRAIAPIGRFFVNRSTAVHNVVTNLTHLGEVRDQNTQLQQQVLTLEQQLINQDTIKRENDVLRSELGVTGVTQTTGKVLAQILFYSGTDPLDRTFTVDVGSDQGIKVGQPAVYQGALIGRVIGVRQNSAVIRSVTSQKSLIPVSLAVNQEQGLITGTGNGIRLQDITQGISIPDQSIVETSGLGGDLPQGILIGTTGALLSAKSDSSQTFAVNQLIDPTAIPSMFILLTDTSS